MSVKFVAVEKDFKDRIWSNGLMNEVNEIAVEKLKIEFARMELNERYKTIEMSPENAKAMGVLPEYRMSLVKPNRVEKNSIESFIEPLKKACGKMRMNQNPAWSVYATTQDTTARFGGEDGKKIVEISQAAAAGGRAVATAYRYMEKWSDKKAEVAALTAIQTYKDIEDERRETILRESRKLTETEANISFRESLLKKRGVNLQPNLNKKQINEVIDSATADFIKDAGIRGKFTETVCGSKFFDKDCKEKLKAKVENFAAGVRMEIKTIEESSENQKKYLGFEIDARIEEKKEAEKKALYIRKYAETVDEIKAKQPVLEKKTEIDRQNGIVVLREKQVFVCPETKEEIQVKSIKQTEKGAVIQWRSRDGKESYWFAVGVMILGGEDEDRNEIALTNGSSITDQSGLELKMVGSLDKGGEAQINITATTPEGETQVFNGVNLGKNAFVPIGREEIGFLRGMGMRGEDAQHLAEPLKVVAVSAEVLHTGNAARNFAFLDSSLTVANGTVRVANLPTTVEKLTQCFQRTDEPTSQFMERAMDEFQTAVASMNEEAAAQAAAAAAEAAAETAAVTAETTAATVLAVPTAGLSYAVEAGIEGIKVGLRVARGVYKAVTEAQKIEQGITEINKWDVERSLRAEI